MCEMWRFSVVHSLASFLNEVAKYQLADMEGFLVFLIGELPKKSCFLFGVAFATLRYKCKASKARYRRKLPTDNAVQTTNHYGETSSGNGRNPL